MKTNLKKKDKKRYYKIKKKKQTDGEKFVI